MKALLRFLSAISILAVSPSALACATCAVKIDTPETRAASVGILFMVGVIGGVLMGVVGFFAWMVSRNPAAQEGDVERS